MPICHCVIVRKRVRIRIGLKLILGLAIIADGTLDGYYVDVLGLDIIMLDVVTVVDFEFSSSIYNAAIGKVFGRGKECLSLYSRNRKRYIFYKRKYMEPVVEKDSPKNSTENTIKQIEEVIEKPTLSPLKAFRAIISKLKRSIWSILRCVACDIVLAISLFVIDLLNYPSALLERHVDIDAIQKSYETIMDSGASCAVALCLLIIACILAVSIIHYKICSNIRDSHLNDLDKTILNLLLVSGLYILLTCFTGTANSRYAIYTSKCFIVIATACFSMRVVIVGLLDNFHKEKSSQLLSLCELYRGEASIKMGAALISDNECDDDIFDRSITINKIASIVGANTNGKSFTLSLVGPWGSGKSTIIKCVKRKLEIEKRKDIIFVDDFQPWIYKDSDTMVVELGNKLLEKIGYKKRFVSSRTIANAFLKITARKDSTGILENIRLPEQKVDPIKIINDYLIEHNKKLVIVLDNLERCESEQVVWFLRIVHNHLLFKNSCYIFSYDEEVMNAGLLRGGVYDRLFLDKFSQCAVSVPKIPEKKKKEVIEKCFNNYFELINFEKGPDFGKLLSVVSSTIETPRELVHVINSAFAGNISFLNRVDSMLIGILKQNAPNLYDIIKNNRQKFVYNSSVYFSAIIHEERGREEIKKYCEKEAAFFKGLHENKECSSEFVKYKPIISHLFPSVSVFLDGQTNEAYFEMGITNGMYEQSYGKRRICRDELFEPYFTQVKNKHVNICDEVDEIIRQDPLAIVDLVSSYVKILDKGSTRDILQHLKERIGDLELNKKDALALSILGIILDMRGTIETKNRAISDWLIDFLATILISVSQPVFENVLDKIRKEYRNLSILNSLERQMFHMNNNSRSERYMFIYESLEKMKGEIINRGINIYTRKNYSRFNVRLLGDRDTAVNYLKKIKDEVSKRNKILILADFVFWGGTGGENFYEIDSKTIESVFSDEEVTAIIRNAKKGALKTAIEKIFSEAIVNTTGYMQGDKAYRGPEIFELFGLCDNYVNG